MARLLVLLDQPDFNLTCHSADPRINKSPSRVSDMEEFRDRVGNAGTSDEDKQFDSADFARGVWDSLAALSGSFSKRETDSKDLSFTDSSSDKSVSGKERDNAADTNQGWRVERKGSNSDQISFAASLKVDPADFSSKNPEFKDKDPKDLLGQTGFKVRHATTNEVDGGWKIEAINKDGSLQMSKEYKLDVQAKKDHGGLVEAIPGVPEEHIKKLEAKIAQLPEHVQKALKDAGYKIIATRFNTDALPELKGLSPRGWDSRSTFDTSDGTHDNVRRVILAPYMFIPENTPAKVSRPEVVVHQVGHALDHANGKLSNDPDFQAAFKKDMHKLAQKPEMSERERLIFDYFNQRRGPSKGENPGSEECFASLFGLVLTGPENPQDKKPFEENFQNSIAVVRKQIENLRRKD